jgi:hypothetical protein
MSDDQFGDDSGRTAAPDDEGEAPGPSERFLAAMRLSQTPEQQEAARRIYRRLAEGAEVDDVKPLIEEMMRVVVTQRNGGRVSGSDPAEEAGPTGISGGTGHRQGAWGTVEDNGLAGQEDERRGR